MANLVICRQNFFRGVWDQGWRQESSDGGADASDGGANYIGTRESIQLPRLLKILITKMQLGEQTRTKTERKIANENSDFTVLVD